MIEEHGRRILRTSPALALMVLVLGLSSRVVSEGPATLRDGSGSYASHMLVYGLLGACMLYAITLQRPMRLRYVTIAVILTTVFGVADELHQHMVPGRTANELDVIADAVGATISCVVILMVIKLRRHGLLQRTRV